MQVSLHLMQMGHHIPQVEESGGCALEDLGKVTSSVLEVKPAIFGGG